MSAFDKILLARRVHDAAEPDNDTEFLDQLNKRKFELTDVQLAAVISGGKPFELNPIYSSRSGSEETVRLIVRWRAKRIKFLPTHLFADPAWDMLLDLYLNDILSKPVSVSSLCRSSNVPMTTALRWIGALDREGLTVRAEDCRDKRRVFVSLSEAGLARMDAYFDNLAQ